MEKQDFDNNLGFLTGDVSRLLRKAYDREVKSFGLTRSQWQVAAYLRRSPGLTQTELADQLDIGKAALGRTLDKLEEGGWLERRPDPEDRRLWRIYPTRKIDPLMPDLLDRAERVFCKALAGVSKRDEKLLVKVLQQMKLNLTTADPTGGKCQRRSKIGPGGGAKLVHSRGSGTRAR